METGNWGQRIRAFRKLKGYTQERFAQAIGVSVSVLGEVERGTRTPNRQLIERVVSVLNISEDELLPQTEKEKN
ncbi:helix-turn-helix transcriptional regulator [Halalkalibacterium halodurans]|jgi:transcriptional regulator with XRE-family HTH domain|uniref:BH0096 protein n=2 Tax=Halalkalibacterium halodurans TaxID=86665 RepID=Q9KGG6_HALH5|nr:helix-turn-helix transcriptional regulator [Halalkalibacterium halodurans]MDY7220598.1 helix-turn-helix transcriptional regulator [Halalkalibacterium halodurans]MDY7239837.1 helix-turn-helix transcriptional regulator [Halalkalibacterium halodurans]MED3648131.1 helix-turn-helix transcriptional regulator [Halalkalibacterium halodurans]MED4080448.1 helix-turn-helix transcriptional regulator [Halalkalibacterium halodurans]MED4085575.1 helix-turn-helix transcriptional regulator [Halalkalibacteri